MKIMPYDFKKEQKDLYMPKTAPSIIDVTTMNYIAVDGKGDPNGDEFGVATELLFALSYSIRMANKAVFEYVVPPLQGLWWVGGDSRDKSAYRWTIMIRQPDFVTADIFETAKATAAKKKPHLNVSEAMFESFSEGLCAQILHIGSYDNEPATINALEKFVIESGYVFDVDDDFVTCLSRRHHEIYLSDPRKVAAEKLKTVIRYPIKKLND
jgi:hypothetical protein